MRIPSGVHSFRRAVRWPLLAGSFGSPNTIGSMTAQNAGALASLYHGLAEIDGTAGPRVCVRHSGTTGDGTRVEVWSLPPGRVDAPIDSPAFAAGMAGIAELQIPGFARLVSWGVAADGTLHAAYEAGATLADEARPAVQVALLGHPIARALAIAHATGKVHGAVSTQALSMRSDGTLQLGGMGFFEALCGAGLDPRDASSIVASAPYASPEQQTGGAPTERSDVYALGATLYELLTGKAPFGGRTTSYVMASVLSEPDLDPDTPADSPAQPAGPAVEVILRAIERAPDDRWLTMDAFATALAASDPASGVTARKRGCLPVAAALLVIAAGVAASI